MLRSGLGCSEGNVPYGTFAVVCQDQSECSGDSCGFCHSSSVGVVYQLRLGSQTEEKCQQHGKLVEMKFSPQKNHSRFI